MNSKDPSSYEDYENSVGMLFQCRPRGGYSHSFFNEAAFDIHAFGEVITHGGNSTNNKDLFADDTMSHNCILVDGRGQYQSTFFPLSGRKDPFSLLPFQRAGYIPAFQKSANTIYWVGDATNAYRETTAYLKLYRRHVLFVKNTYFVIFDELKTDPEHGPCKFQWPYHILPYVPVDFVEDQGALMYQINKARIKVQHIASTGDLFFEDRKGMEGIVNPVTGEDFSEYANAATVFNHNIWISNKTPASDFHFMTVVFPYRVKDMEPEIVRLDDMTVKVKHGRYQEVISFDANSSFNPDIKVNFHSIAPAP